MVETVEPIASTDIGIDESDVDSNSDSEPTIENDTSWFHFQLMRGSRAPSYATRTRARRSTRRRQLAIQRRCKQDNFAQSALAFMAFVCSTVRAVGSRMRYRSPVDDHVVVRRRTAALGTLVDYFDRLSLFNGFKLWVSSTVRDAACMESERARTDASRWLISLRHCDTRTPLRALYPKPDYCCSCADSTRYARLSCHGEDVRSRQEVILEVNPPECATPHREFDTALASPVPSQDTSLESTCLMTGSIDERGVDGCLLATVPAPGLIEVRTTGNSSLTHFDTCATGCFDFDTGRCVPGVSSEPGLGRVKTAAGCVKPTSIRLVRNNHLVTLAGGKPAVITKLCNTAILPDNMGISSITSAPVYKRLHVGYFGSNDPNGVDRLNFGCQARDKNRHPVGWRCAMCVVSEPCKTAPNGLPLCPLLTDDAVLQSGLPRYHSHTLPDLVPYDDHTASALLNRGVQKRLHYLQTHHIPLPIDLFPEAISNLHTLLCNFGIEHHALITTPGTTVELDVGDGDSDCDDADQSPVLEYSLRSEHVTASEPEPSPDEAAPVVAPPLEVVVPTWVHETLLAGVGELYPLHVPDVHCTALATAYERISIAKQAQFTCALICCGIGTALFFQRWLQPQLHGSRWMCSSLPIKIELVCEINSDQRDFMRKYLPKGARILDDLRAVVHGFRNSTLDPRDYYTDFVELTAPCYANTPLRHHNNAAEHNDKDLFLLAVEYCWWIRPRRCVFEMTPEYGHAYEDHQQVVKAMHQCDLHPQVTPRFPSCYCGDATHRDRFVANCSTHVSPAF